MAVRKNPTIRMDAVTELNIDWNTVSKPTMLCIARAVLNDIEKIQHCEAEKSAEYHNCQTRERSYEDDYSKN